MTPATSLELEMCSEPRCLPEIRERIRHWMETRDWSEPQVGEIVLALDEAVTNVIRHGYDNRPEQPIEIRVDSIADQEHGEGLEIRVRDYGKQVDPAVICGRDLDDIRPGGLGVHIIRAMTSNCEYRRADGGGMLLIMRKFRTHTADYGGRMAERG